MSVVLNEVALRALLSSEQGPVFRDLERRANAAADALQIRINEIISNELVRPNADVRMTPEGAVVGIVDLGSVSDYIGFKLGVREPWWEPFGAPAAAKDFGRTL